jgi:hypothetical protein
MIFAGGLTREKARTQRRQLMREIAEGHRKEERAKLAKLREQIRRERHRYRDERGRAVRQCRAERRQSKEDAKKWREEVRASLRRTVEDNVAQAREACRERKVAARTSARVRPAEAPARGPNPYEAKKAARIDRMRGRAERLRGASEAKRRAVRQVEEMIPLGQPILVGHHSERRHRRDLERIRSGFSKSVELGQRADELERRARGAELSRAISSDDPEAIEKLRAKLAELEQSRARMVAANKAARSSHPHEALARLGFSDRLIQRILTPDAMGNIAFPRYALANAAHEASRVRKRIAELEAKATRPAAPAVTMGGARVEESDNRVRLFFEGKPAAELRTELKRRGFRWSPTVGAWQRHASPAAWHAAEVVLKGRHP